MYPVQYLSSQEQSSLGELSYYNAKTFLLWWFPSERTWEGKAPTNTICHIHNPRFFFCWPLYILYCKHFQRHFQDTSSVTLGHVCLFSRKKRKHRQRVMVFEVKMKANNEGREEVVRHINFSVLPGKRQVFKEGNTHILHFESSHQHWVKTSKCLCVGFLKGKLIFLFSLFLLHMGRSSFP